MAERQGWLKRWTQSPDEIRARHLKAWAATIAGTTPMAAVESRCHCRVAGVIKTLRIDPRQGTGSIEATVTDGSGQMVARWLGRQTMSGIKLGTGLILEGVAGDDGDGNKAILNPEYELVPGPEHG